MTTRLDPITLSRVLKHYKRLEVQQEIVNAALNKESVGSYGGKGYGKRPDVLVYPNDVMEQVRNGVTSFHVSEEIWSNPQRISINLKRQEYDDLRIGWDLVLDIDCPYWEFAKLVTWLFIISLKEHGIEAVTVKFSGNKGFHIGVPFEAFPEWIHEKMTKDLFPEGPRKIALYLLDYISKKHVRVDTDRVTFAGNHTYTVEEFEQNTGILYKDLIINRCKNCGLKAGKEEEKKVQFTCSSCGSSITAGIEDQYRTCTKCNIIMDKESIDSGSKCCNNPDVLPMFNPLSIVEVDTVLIAPRHLFRAPYSYHEKSGLASVIVSSDEVLEFDKKSAEPENITFGRKFLDRDVRRGQATTLLVEALDFAARKERIAREKDDMESFGRELKKEYEDVQTAIPEQFFPPCIKLLAKGLEDGKKRAVFIINNFLSSCGWEYDDIEIWMKKWNEQNRDPLREQYFVGQIRYAKQHKKKVLPPNCDNAAYYKSFGVCKPDNFCKYIKNPANYAIKRARYAQNEGGKGKKRGNEGNKGDGKGAEGKKDKKAEGDIDEGKKIGEGG
ncbi:hypothetical protein HQ545_00255 [Candidatus Woesearchaeota archaeon]|nr:hypothetical protein [Candidatus Woesearchaeota archaeon]